jgi:hypothetical protein
MCGKYQQQYLSSILLCLQVWQYSQAKAKNPVPTWLLAYGGIGICLGLATCKRHCRTPQHTSHWLMNQMQFDVAPMPEIHCPACCKGRGWSD